MEEKIKIIEAIEQKGLDIKEIAEKIEFDPILLKLYLNRDDYPVPKRILKKVEEIVLN
ncbi:hypothetical protein [Thermodesulforhabdus norvegica]|uniref:Uncharacterized protein n=1 Tax=Thermodesulforhabdus norvegica TaxID=39841 RepID=A0A1I4RHD6_9BACT|nr:hypothetical protein [Thermodesulforhabdus norvegica]SFM51692.1 hypothetical protein SAMN05660836_00623 [Thermodesulforhabdus norvegica]